MKKAYMLRIIAVLLIFSVVVLLPAAAFAAPNGNALGSLSIAFFHEEKPIEGATFHINKVAEMQGSEYVLTEDFEKYNVSLKNIENVDTLGSLVTTLSACVARDYFVPYSEGVTDSKGRLYISDIEEGLYFVTGDRVTINGTTYIPRPFIFAMPGENNKYDVSVEPKYDLFSDDGPETVNRRVLKIWDDSENKNGSRPESITVQLLRNGDIFDEIVLNEENNWRYNWEMLSAEDQWLVIEKEVPDDYVLSIAQQGITFTITNTYNGTTPPEDTTNLSGTTNPTDPNKPSDPSNSSNSGKPGNSNTLDRPTLPQTGQLWWPVPVLLFAGFLLCAMGIVLRSRSEGSDA